MDVHAFLANIWFGLLGLLLVFYVVLDGFTLGIGILSLFCRTDENRGLMMSSLGSVWDANETWLVVFGGALFGAFPLVYGVVLHSLYVPVMVMIFALIFRGVSFEYRGQGRRKLGWNLAFGIGSLVAAAAQGYILGAVLSGIPVQGGEFAGSIWFWISPFASLAAAGVVLGYALLGATYLIIKTEGALQDRTYRFARLAGWLTVLAGIGVSVWTPIHFPYVADRWFSWPGLVTLAPLPGVAAIAFVMFLRALRKRYERAPFVWSIVIFVASFCGLAVSLYPYLVPPSIDVVEAAASAKTLVFMLTGIGMLIPVMIIYNAYQYLVFRGKVRPGDEGYE